jgi:hypothetical protein
MNWVGSFIYSGVEKMRGQFFLIFKFSHRVYIRCVCVQKTVAVAKTKKLKMEKEMGFWDYVWFGVKVVAFIVVVAIGIALSGDPSLANDATNFLNAMT